MNYTVALVQAYLQINGYFTVAECPIIESTGKRRFNTATNLDVLAFRLPGAGRNITDISNRHINFLPSPMLGTSGHVADIIIGEIKEGKAELNRSSRVPNVLKTALGRFGCCSLEQVDSVVEQLIHKGRATTHDNHRIRLMAFGSVNTYVHSYNVITTGHIVQFIEDYLDEHWEVLCDTQFKHSVMALFMVLKKARMNMKGIAL